MTGQFTQSDPIGVAGGLNAYGFAAGDPVSYSDPFGLCPDHLWNEETQTCPGGMTHGEYDQMQHLILSGTTGPAQTGLLSMLQGGRIVVNEQMVGSETRVQVHHYPTLRPSYLRIGPTFWNSGTADAAYTLAHDLLTRGSLGSIAVGWPGMAWR